ncbi:hypothetical protein CPC08DRAFT_92421 [Agrocybe pediades]|nr:hypothetical protein CPC08DRAFT_92421 [Agrocybe pediades]
MFLTPGQRRMWKQTLSIARAKLLYSRITLTGFTTCYFFFAIAACVVLCSLQGVAFSDNTMAVSALNPLLQGMSVNGLVVLDNGVLQTCTSIPRQRGTTCTTEIRFGSKLADRADETLVHKQRHKNGGIELETQTSNLSLPDTCMLSLHWLRELIEDDEREDVVTLAFQIWLFSLAMVTILNESLPHLGAALFGHVLNSAWAAYRLKSTYSLTKLYRTAIVPQACAGQDLLGSWWDLRIRHAIPIVVVNAVILMAFVYISVHLYKVYAEQSFSRVGASPGIHRVYKIVLSFSVSLQICTFFALATAAMWIDKVCHGSVKLLAKHSKLYLVAFIISLVLQFPWLHLGWVCARRECNIRFGIFCATCVFLLSISILMFFSPLYRYIIGTWAFFATVTITAFALTVVTSVLAVVCRLNFGKGLEHFLRVTDALEGVDFTPVSFLNIHEKDPEKGSTTRKSALALSRPVTVQLPGLTYQPGIRKQRGSSIYSDDQGNPVMLSSSPPLVSELGPRPTTIMWSRSHIEPYPQVPSVNHALHVADKATAMEEDTKSESSHGSGPSLDKAPRRDERSAVRRSMSSSSSAAKLRKQGLPANPRAGGTETRI